MCCLVLLGFVLFEEGKPKLFEGLLGLMGLARVSLYFLNQGSKAINRVSNLCRVLGALLIPIEF